MNYLIKTKAMVKLTVLYGHPKEPAIFEEYYINKHLPLAAKMKGFSKAEFTKFLSAPDGTQAAFYRMAEFWFNDLETMQTTMSSTEGSNTAADLANFATGGVNLLVGGVEN